MDIRDVEVFIGIDAGESERWIIALSRDRQEAPDKVLPNDEDRLREVYQRLQVKGWILMVVGQSVAIGALAVAVTQGMGIVAGYLPGLPTRRITDLTPGSAETGARGAAVITQAARATPHTLRAISISDEGAVVLSMLTGFDLDLARQVNRTANRIRGPYTQTHPALERVLESQLEHNVVLEVIVTWPIPADLERVGEAGIDARLKEHGYRRYATWADQIVSALKYQIVVVAGTDAAVVALPYLARQLITLHARWVDVAARIETLVQVHSPYQVLISTPGIGVRTAAVFLTETLGKTFNTSARLASYVGLVPVIRRPDLSIRGKHVSHGGNKRLERVIFPSTSTSLRSDPASRAYYQRRRDQGKRHNQAALTLAHRRILTLHAIIRNGAPRDPQPAAKLPAVA